MAIDFVIPEMLSGKAVARRININIRVNAVFTAALCVADKWDEIGLYVEFAALLDDYDYDYDYDAAEAEDSSLSAARHYGW